MNDDESGTIEVGETGDTLRFWRAKEAIRHAETHLTAQASSLSAMETRATSILGWATTGVFALGAAAISGQYRAGASVAASALFASAVFVILGLWPRDWGIAGCAPLQVMDSKYDSELEILESIAQGYANTVSLNNKRLTSFSTMLRTSWIFFVASPMLAVVALYLAGWFQIRVTALIPSPLIS